MGRRSPSLPRCLADFQLPLTRILPPLGQILCAEVLKMANVYGRYTNWGSTTETFLRGIALSLNLNTRQASPGGQGGISQPYLKGLPLQILGVAPVSPHVSHSPLPCTLRGGDHKNVISEGGMDALAATGSATNIGPHHRLQPLCQLVRLQGIPAFPRPGALHHPGPVVHGLLCRRERGMSKRRGEAKKGEEKQGEERGREERGKESRQGEGKRGEARRGEKR